ncbi:hypothetical protein [Pelagibacterium montanilacus]|uniref:hypothetical protein n=1 Tax=Pelagibacterium montanilacus TaxID=2185280 RepID=UPI000F8DFB9E|nr:hypothetical protein [Pelagibacterium montanilacus]
MATTSPPRVPGGSVSDTAKAEAHRVRKTADEDWNDAKAQARDDIDDLKRGASEEFGHARDAAGKFAAGQKDQAADQIGGLASAFDRMGQELNESKQSWIGRYAGDMAGHLKGIAQHTRASSVDDLVGDVERFGRERPAAFLTGAAILGFAATRFLSASADRRSRGQGSGNKGYSSDSHSEPRGGEPFAGSSDATRSGSPARTTTSNSEGGRS